MRVAKKLGLCVWTALVAAMVISGCGTTSVDDKRVSRQRYFLQAMVLNGSDTGSDVKLSDRRVVAYDGIGRVDIGGIRQETSVPVDAAKGDAAKKLTPYEKSLVAMVIPEGFLEGYAEAVYSREGVAGNALEVRYYLKKFPIDYLPDSEVSAAVAVAPGADVAAQIATKAPAKAEAVVLNEGATKSDIAKVADKTEAAKAEAAKVEDKPAVAEAAKTEAKPEETKVADVVAKVETAGEAKPAAEAEKTVVAKAAKTEAKPEAKAEEKPAPQVAEASAAKPEAKVVRNRVIDVARSEEGGKTVFKVTAEGLRVEVACAAGQESAGESCARAVAARLDQAISCFREAMRLAAAERAKQKDVGEVGLSGFWGHLDRHLDVEKMEYQPLRIKF